MSFLPNEIARRHMGLLFQQKLELYYYRHWWNFDCTNSNSITRNWNSYVYSVFSLCLCLIGLFIFMFTYLFIGYVVNFGKTWHLENKTMYEYKRRPSGSSGKALGYGLDGPGSNTDVGRVGIIFFTPSCPDFVLASVQRPIKWVSGLSSGVKAVERRTSYLTLSSAVAVHPHPPWDFMACNGDTYTFYEHEHRFWNSSFLSQRAFSTILFTLYNTQAGLF